MADLLSQAASRNNFKALIWHAGFLALAQNFIDIDTIIPAMLVESGGTAIHVGILTAIMLGGSSVTQLIFAPFISNFSFKRKFLLTGINSRMLALLAMVIMLYFAAHLSGDAIIALIFVLITVFSLGGAFANISYTDILGKSLARSSRKRFFSSRQVISGSILLGSAFVAKQVVSGSDYPENYAWMFFIGFLALSIASLGFWKLREEVPSRLPVKNPKHFMQLVRTEIRHNPKLSYFLGFINTQGISIAFLPFVILYAKEFYQTGSSDTGSFLLFKVIGSVITRFSLFLLAGKFRYRMLQYLNALLALVIPLLIMLWPGEPPFKLLFLVGGLVFAIYNITMNGVLLEISGTGNRALYTGIAGAGNIIPALFPVVGGILISAFGFHVFFILYMALMITSVYFTYKIACIK